MDLKLLDLHDKAGKGIEVELLHPGTNELLKGDDGKPLILTVVGKDSLLWDQITKKIQRKLAAKYKNRTIPVSEMENSIIQVLAHCTITVSSNIEFGEGKKLKCAPGPLLDMYTALPWAGEQVLEKAADRAQLFLELSKDLKAT